MNVRLVGASAAALLVGLLASNAGANHSALEQVSVGQINGNGAFSASLNAISEDGMRAFFISNEQLVAADTDSSRDVYQRSGGTTTLVSAGQINGNGAFTADFSGASADGTHVFFVTSEQLVSADTDTQQDVYERFGGTTTLVSTGPAGGNGAFTAFFAGNSRDGTHALFTTLEQLVAADTDSSQDVYDRSGGVTTLVSTGQINGNGAFGASFSGISEDNTRVFFRTLEPLVAADTDSAQDIYERSGGITTLLSIGPSGGNAFLNANFSKISQDGTRVFFVTDESLVAADTDTQQDVYERSGGTTTLLSTGSAGGNGALQAGFSGATNDGSRVFITTAESLVAADTDSSLDVYQRSSGTTTLISTGPSGGNGAFGASFTGVSQDGSRVFFVTSESLVAADTDTRQDVYERAGATTTWMSTGPNGGNAAIDAFFVGASADGVRVFIVTAEALLAADTDVAQDVYERWGGTTTRISTGPGGGNGAFIASFGRVSLDGGRVFISTDESLAGTDTDSSTDIYVAAGFPVPPYPTAGAPGAISVSLMPAFRQTVSSTQCASTGRTPTTHGAPFSVGSCNPPAFPNGTAAFFGRQAQGTATLTALAGNPLTATNEGDETVSVSLTDIRAGSLTGADYNPNAGGADLTLLTKLRISDLYNGGSLTDPGTASDLDLAVPVTCSDTASAETGASCSVSSTVNAVTPGAIAEGRQTVLNTFRVRLNDAGANGTRGDGDDRNFAMQGTYVP